MDILLYQDDTLNLDLDTIALGLNDASDSSLNVRKGNARFRILMLPIRHPTSKSAELSF